MTAVPFINASANGAQHQRGLPAQFVERTFLHDARHWNIAYARRMLRQRTTTASDPPLAPHQTFTPSSATCRPLRNALKALEGSSTRTEPPCC